MCNHHTWYWSNTKNADSSNIVSYVKEFAKHFLHNNRYIRGNIQDDSQNDSVSITEDQEQSGLKGLLSRHNDDTTLYGIDALVSET